MKGLWKAIRQLSGDNAYERYLAHCRMARPGRTPMDRKEFFVKEQERKWSGVKRCC